MFISVFSIYRLHSRAIALALLILGLASIVLVSPTQASGPPLPLDEYWQLVEETQVLVVSLKDAPSEIAHAQLSDIAERWERATQLILSDETVTPVDHSFFISQLRSDPPDMAQLDRLLTVLLEARDTWPQSPTASPDTDTLDQILARPEFQWQPEQPSPLTEWWLRLQERFWEFISSLLSSDSNVVGIPLLRYALTGLGTLMLILVLAYVLRSLVADFVADTEIDPDNAIGDENMTATTALERAQLLSGEGDYRTAVRYLYLSSLLLLEERGLLHYDRSLTNREYLRAIAHLPQLTDTFRDVVQVFDCVWYGYQSLDEAAYVRYADQVTELGQQK
ncbi:MAG: DUF4129 domain-containing protein [Chloroflexi bacterium]|nr:DUF4129 domain-containing protein [Chloroflexota bacterium]